MEVAMQAAAQWLVNLLMFAYLVWCWRERTFMPWQRRLPRKRRPHQLTEADVRINEAAQQVLEVSELCPLDITDQVHADLWNKALAGLKDTVQSPTHTIQFNHQVPFFWRWKMRHELRKAAQSISAVYEVREIRTGSGWLFVVSMSSTDAEALGNAVSKWTHAKWKTAVTN